MGGGGSKTTQTIENRDPWWGQQPYLRDAFSEAQNIYRANKDNPAYQGDFYAELRPEQIDTFKNALGYANGPGAGTVDTLRTSGGNTLSSSMAGAGAGMGGLYGLSGDNTNTIVNNAGKFAENPYVDGMINAAMRDANRNASENVIPNLYRNAAATGNINSDRTALAQGVVERGLAEKAADVSAQIRGGLYSEGINQAASDLDRRMGGYSALSKYGLGGTELGAGMLSDSIAGQGALLDMAGTASDRLQMGDQARIDNEMSKFEYLQAKPWEALSNYYGIIGDKSWGGTTTSFGTVKEKPSAMSSIGSGLGILGSLLKLSDRRLKIVKGRVGEYAGVPLYVYAYKHAPDRLVVGPMAQDIRKVNPEAVHEDAYGYLTVDFMKL